MLFSLINTASAHEAYVMKTGTFWSDIQSSISLHAFSALKDPSNLRVTIVIVLCVWLALGLNFWFLRSSLGQTLTQKIEKLAWLGPHLIRYALALAFFFASTSGTFLGPELNANLFPYAALIKTTLFIISIFVALGLFTEIVALAGIIIYIIGFFVFGRYVFTYLNYFGELVVLLLFGLRTFSLDAKIFSPLQRFPNFAKYENFIVRAFYGLALIYAAVTVKILHPEITVDVINTWHLNQYHWLFPHDPLLITLGAGIVEAVIGLFILIGFQTRLTVLVSLFYITLSLLFFRELVWPHLMLYGISLSLLVQPQVLALDNVFFKKKESS